MAEAKQRHKEGGQAVYKCDDHQQEVGLSWGAGYPPFDPPECAGPPGHPMERVGGQDPAENLEDVPELEPVPAP